MKRRGLLAQRLRWHVHHAGDLSGVCSLLAYKFAKSSDLQPA